MVEIAVVLVMAGAVDIGLVTIVIVVAVGAAGVSVTRTVVEPAEPELGDGFAGVVVPSPVRLK